MIRAIIFDFDGVILESSEIKTEVFHKLFADIFPDHINQIVRYHKDNMGISRYIKFKYIYNNILGLPFSDENGRVLGERFSALALQEILEVPFVPGAEAFLTQQYNLYDLFIASGTPQEELGLITGFKGISPCFKGIYGSPPDKSSIIFNILKSYGFNAHQVVFVGDAHSDLKAAEDTGVHFIARIHPSGNQLDKCRFKINDLSQLKGIIEVLESQGK